MAPRLYKPNQKKRPLFRVAMGAKYRKTDGTSSAPTNLPLAGPFASLSNTPIAGLSSPTIDGNLTITGSDCSESGPLKYNTFTLNGGSILAYAPDGGQAVDFPVCGAIFLWVNDFHVTGGGSFSVTGGSATNGGDNGRGGDGGNGASGGGSGASARGGCCCTGCCPTFVGGGNGGSGTNGGFGGGINCSNAGNPGTGVAAGAYSYSYGSGENASTSGSAIPGNGGNGFGGGGVGGDVDAKLSPCNFYYAGGGGAGGGLSVCIGNTLSGSNAFTITTAGGSAGGGDGGGFDGTGGGRGVIYWAFRSKTMVGSPTLIANSSQIFKINSNNTLTAKTWASTW